MDHRPGGSSVQKAHKRAVVAACDPIISRRQIASQATPIRRTRAYQSAEHPGEVRLVCKAAPPRNLTHRLIRHHHHLLSTFHTSLVDVSVECHAETDFEGAAELADAQSCNRGAVLRTDRRRQCCIDMLGDLAHLPGRKTTTRTSRHRAATLANCSAVIFLQESGCSGDVVLRCCAVVIHCLGRAIKQFDDYTDERDRSRDGPGHWVGRVVSARDGMLQ